ncbi:hypothetical protein FB639_000749 [Coemansia asiatica]|nr:hypothetical protein FB639_000749 [Coemansia asiatica]
MISANKATATLTQKKTHPDASMDIATDSLDVDFELGMPHNNIITYHISLVKEKNNTCMSTCPANDSESEYMLVSCREPTPTPGDCSNDRDADSSAEHSSSDLDMRQGSSQNSTAASCAPHGHLLSLRLVFPSEDGGVLIGKNGRHINKLKETTTATWLISSGHAFDDRIVTISGSVADIASVSVTNKRNPYSWRSQYFPHTAFAFPVHK